jgi:hypothetical protein
MASADQIGRGILINEEVASGASKVSQVFQAAKGANSVHLCCHITHASGTPTATWLIEVEDPTTENESTFTGLTQKTFSAASVPADQVDKDTIKKYNFVGGPGSRVRCTVTPASSDATVKVWAWSSY